MQISKLLRNSAKRFNTAADQICMEWTIAVGSSGICSPSDRIEFEKLVKSRLIMNGCESSAIVHTNISEANTYVQSKLSA